MYDNDDDDDDDKVNVRVHLVRAIDNRTMPGSSIPSDVASQFGPTSLAVCCCCLHHHYHLLLFLSSGINAHFTIPQSVESTCPLQKQCANNYEQLVPRLFVAVVVAKNSYCPQQDLIQGSPACSQACYH